MKLLVGFIVSVGLTICVLWWFLGPVSGRSRPGLFAVPENAAGFDAAKKLEEEGFVRNAVAFRLLTNIFAKDKKITSGGYRLDPTMNAWQVMKIITAQPQLLWVTTSGCLRREQIGEMLGQKLGWNEEKLKQWNEAYASTKQEYTEGVYFPDTYLLPRDESGTQIADRFVNRFNEKLSPLVGAFAQKNIKWTTGLKIASLIQREAAGPVDMKLIAGIIWNRLDKGILLQIDATMQYTRGKKSDGSWWGAVDIAEKRSDSPYNTYLHKGLPPTPICSPGLDAIQAVLEPEETDCIFYLHDANKQIHCAATYEGHKANIRKYL